MARMFSPCLIPILFLRRFRRALRRRPTLLAEAGAVPPTVADLVDLDHAHRYAPGCGP